MSAPRISIYFKDESYKQLQEIIHYLETKGDKLYQGSKNTSAAFLILVDTFHRLFVENNEDENYMERMSQLEKNYSQREEFLQMNMRQMQKQLDQLFYLELSNFHATTKGESWDIQDLESKYSRLDPQQHELLARIQDVIQEDTARGQTVKHSH